MAASRPNFFIVGGPKCGTTALFTYLSRHPEVFVPPEFLEGFGKWEPCHFATDLLPPEDRWRDRHHYLHYYRNGHGRRRLGDASVYHLVSSVAAENINAFDPQAKIIIMIRHPAEMIPSLHAQMVYNGDEPLEDIEEALAAEPDRLRGEHLPDGLRFSAMLCYRRLASFSAQVSRYMTVFDPQQILVLDFADFTAHTSACVMRTLEFLDLNPGEIPAHFDIVNPRKEVRSYWLHRLAHRPPTPIRRLAGVLLPRAMRAWGRRRLALINRHYNTVIRHKTGSPSPLQDRLRQAFAPEVTALRELTGLPLRTWSADGH